MDYKKLADLLYPNLNYTTEYWENLYPNRNLPSKAEVTRFAPSPTGYMHIGHFFGASLDYVLAKSTNGIFYFRLEDTDKKREVVDSDIIALKTLKSFNIEPDEGFTIDRNNNGNYGPYRQSDRMAIYQTYAKKLIADGKAFPCFCEKPENKQEVLEKRQEELEQLETIEEKDDCRNLTLEQIEELINQHKPFAIRLKSSGHQGERITVFDEVRGQREIGKNCKDVILIKSNGIPPYAFAHPIDDHLMHTTTVVRGEEWLSTLPQHIEIHQALNIKPPKYIHTPVLCKIGENGNKRKLSKRLDPESDMRYYLAEGIPQESISEYIMTLLNSNFEIWRNQNPTTALSSFPFSVNKIGTSSPMFDIVKLLDISKTIISKMSAETFYNKLTEWAVKYDLDFFKYLENNKEFAIKTFSIDRYTPKPRKDIAKWSEVKGYYNYMFGDIKNYEFNERYNKTQIAEILKEYLKLYDLNDDKQTWFNKIKSMCEKFNFCPDMKLYKANPESYLGSVADLSSIIRVAITGKNNSPDLYEIMKVLGKNTVTKRLLLK